MDRVIEDGQEHWRAKQSCCQSKEVESSSLEAKHGDGNSCTEPAGDKTGSGHGGQLSMPMAGVHSVVRGLLVSILLMERKKEEVEVFLKLLSGSKTHMSSKLAAC